MKIVFAPPGLPKTGSLVVGVAEGRALGETAAALDRDAGGALTRAMESSRFTGKRGQFLSILAPANLAVGRVLLAGIGEPGSLEAGHFLDLGGNAFGQLSGTGETEATVVMADGGSPVVPTPEAAAQFALGFRLRSYRFDKYRTRLKEDQRPTLETLTAMVSDPDGAGKRFAELDRLADGVFLTRDLVSEPGNILYPESLAAAAKTLGELGVTVEVLDEHRMAELGMGSLLCVGRGSARPPRLIVMRWLGGGDAAPVALIGKGITFDTGGISIKPSAGMEDMKWDMAGAGAVVGAMKSVAGRKAKANVVGIVAAAENMPDGDATRPGDIVTSMSGQTIEVNNTDAEGRLVLADALWYAQEKFKPAVMIDLATLTGAILIALGNDHAGLYANDDTLASQLEAAGKDVGEKLWRMPLAEVYDKLIDSDVADVKNISGGREAGSIVAAQFLQRFVNGCKWAHLDIAGSAWSKRDAATVPKGATGFGVRLLDRFIAANYEGK